MWGANWFSTLLTLSIIKEYSLENEKIYFFVRGRNMQAEELLWIHRALLAWSVCLHHVFAIRTTKSCESPWTGDDGCLVGPSGRTRRAERRQRLGQATAFCFQLNRNEIHPEESREKFWTRPRVNNAECRWVGPHLVTKTIPFPRLGLLKKGILNKLGLI